ncbi:ThiF family adenylyltransferase [Paenibacillus sp. N3/727]|uniref:ThiF family adenylyltransferase n=1 Tax=Paenibacillus sp. N3/727 TaxID=2925845 RepID=UPI001F52EF95|nr:ThiF family adenylyltransferase [Paenibacillus sp. N3/727]
MQEHNRESRYSRQERFAPFGVEGQAKLGSSHVLIVGAGALGSAVAETLVRAGVGWITIVDRDYVEWSNLQRQQLFTEQDAERHLPKAEAAKLRLKSINSEVKIEAHVMDVRAEELEELARDCDLIMDATDNFDTRLIINDISQKQNTPWIYGGCVGSAGMTYTFLPGHTPCLHCLLGTVPLGGDTCDTTGILPQAVQMVAAHQSMEAMKFLAGHRDTLRLNLLSFDLWRNESFEMKVDQARKSDCPSCGSHPVYPFLSSVNSTKTEVLCGRDTVQIRPARRMELDLKLLADRLTGLAEGKTALNPYMVIFQMSRCRIVFFADGRALIHGTSDLMEAKSLYHRYLG